MENTVTISLEKYEAMKAEITELRKEVQKKTIVKKVAMPYIRDGVIIVVVLVTIVGVYVIQAVFPQFF